MAMAYRRTPVRVSIKFKFTKRDQRDSDALVTAMPRIMKPSPVTALTCRSKGAEKRLLRERAEEGRKRPARCLQGAAGNYSLIQSADLR